MKKKYLICGIFFISFILLNWLIRNNIYTYAYVNNDDIENAMIINPLWETYMSLSDEEKKNWEVIPEKYIVEFRLQTNKNNKKKGSDISETFVAPSSYDLRNDNGVNYATPVKNQSSLGLCWAFATVSSLETNILKLGLRSPDNPAIFAENQLDYISANPISHTTYVNNTVQTITEGYNPYHPTRQLGSGGSFAGIYLARGVSVPYQDGVWGTSYTTTLKTKDLKDVFDMSTTDYIVTDYVNFPYINNSTATEEKKIAWRNLIKEHIMKYGSIYIATIAPQRSSSYACYVNYNNTSDHLGLINWTSDCNSGNYKYSGSHAMSIIGWDDNYTQSYCALPNTGNTNTTYNQETCENNGGIYRTVNGAWILKNSWGNYQAYNYVHLAYDSSMSSAAGITRTIIKDFDNAYNTIGPKVVSTDTSTRVTEQTFFKSNNDETLKRISFNTSTTNNTNYDIYLINGVSNKEIKIGTTKAINVPGRYSVDITDNYQLTGSYFKIRIVPSNKTYSDQANEVYAFTNNSTGEEIHNITTVNSYTKSNNTYSYNVTTRTDNVDNATKLTFEITDQTGNIIPLIEDYDYGYTVANADTTTLKSELPFYSGLYHIKTYANDTLIGVDAFAINTTLSGSGTEENPYLIKKIEDFEYLFTSKYGDKYFILNNDIDLSEYTNFTPINSDNFNYLFSGTLDGNNHTIYNLTQNGPISGFFAKISGNIKNLHFKNANITTNQYGGILAAESLYANISNVSVEGKIKATNDSAYIGGIVGIAKNTNIDGVYNKSSLNGGVSGSIVGNLQEHSSVINAFNLGEFINPTPTLTSFVGNIKNDHNTLSSLIDYQGKEHDACNKSLNVNYQSDELLISDIYYYQNGDCEYLGNNLNYDEIRTISHYNNFDKSVWVIEDGTLPTLRNIPTKLTYSINVDDLINLVTNGTYQLNFMTNPDNVTYPEVKISSNDSSKANYLENKIVAYEPGLVSFTITALDGTHTTKSFDLYIFNEDELTTINNEKFMTFTSKGEIDTILKPSDITVESEMTIGTGATVHYKLKNQIVGSFKIIIKGDLNGDGKNNSLDLSVMLNHISGKSSLNNEYLNAAQLNNDIKVNSQDLAYLLNKIAGKEGY